jgi:hypothetical protein
VVKAVETRDEGAPYGAAKGSTRRPTVILKEGIHMPSHSKAIREYEIQHALSEALGFLGVALYVGVVTGVVAQVAILAGLLS